MTRCRQTDALLDAAFAGLDLTRPQAGHAAACAECAHALAQLRRFEGELERIGHDLAPEPMPPAEEVPVTPTKAMAGGAMTLRRGLVAIGVGVLAIGISLGGNWWLASLVGEPLRGGEAGSVADLRAWLDRAFPRVVEETGRPVDADHWRAVQVERCGRTAIAFWAEEGGSRAYRWAIGDPMNRLAPLRAAGLAASLAHPAVAEMRAELPVCNVVQELTLTRTEALAALDAARRRWERQTQGRFNVYPIPGQGELAGSSVIDVSAGGPGSYWILLERTDGIGMDRLSVMEDGSGYRLDGAAVDGALPDQSGVYVDPGPTSGLFYGSIGSDAVAAVDLIGASGTLRYPATAPGFILDVPLDPDGLTEYRFLDDQGQSVSSGSITVSCGLGTGVDLFQMGRGATFCVSRDR